ncbi:golgin-45-like isoform X2 [Dreissena polymorpha]|nr:golgin-45-like isoform X2 [Dreissena polymorpha]
MLRTVFTHISTIINNNNNLTTTTKLSKIINDIQEPAIMSTSTGSVKPRRTSLKQSNNQSHGTVLLRNPMPKYSFEQKTKKNTEQSKSSTKKDISESIHDSIITVTAKALEELSSSDKTMENTNEQMQPVSTATFNQNIGRLVNSFPQKMVETSQSKENDASAETRSEKTNGVKPVNKVGPISKQTVSVTMAHSVSEPVIPMPSDSNSKHGAVINTNRVQNIDDSSENSADNMLRTASGTRASLSLEDQSASESTETGTFTEKTGALSLAGNQSVCAGIKPSANCKCSEKVKHLEEEKQMLKNQLEVQLQVNQELKKLLVASVGEDLQHRVERLTRDKALLSQEVGDYSKRLCDDYEHLDKISIQADMWRSKYLACRVMADELASSKAFYVMQLRECQSAIEKLLSERHQLRANLYDSYRGLQQIHDAFDPLHSQASVGPRLLTSKNCLDLARTNQHLVEAIKYRLLPSHVTSAINSNMEPDWHDYLTQAESHAKEILSREMRPEDFRCLATSHRLALNAPGVMSVDRFHPWANFDNLTLNDPSLRNN